MKHLVKVVYNTLHMCQAS